jgi:hypothetical protein
MLMRQVLISLPWQYVVSAWEWFATAQNLNHTIYLIFNILHLIINTEVSDLRMCMLQLTLPGMDGLCLNGKEKGRKLTFLLGVYIRPQWQYDREVEDNGFQRGFTA